MRTSDRYEVVRMALSLCVVYEDEGRLYKHAGFKQTEYALELVQPASKGSKGYVRMAQWGLLLKSSLQMIPAVNKPQRNRGYSELRWSQEGCPHI